MDAAASRDHECKEWAERVVIDCAMVARPSKLDNLMTPIKCHLCRRRPHVFWANHARDDHHIRKHAEYLVS